MFAVAPQVAPSCLDNIGSRCAHPMHRCRLLPSLLPLTLGENGVSVVAVIGLLLSSFERFITFPNVVPIDCAWGECYWKGRQSCPQPSVES